MENGIWNPSFLRLWVGSTAAGFATWGLPFLFGLALTQQAIDAETLGALLALRTAGFLVGVLFGGTIADRLSRRLVVLWSSLIAACGISLIILGMGLSGGSAMALMMFGSAVSGVGQGACRPAYQALVPMLIHKDSLQPANAAMSLSVRVTVLLGPVMASAVALWAGIGPAMVMLAAIWVISALVPSWVEPRRTTPAKGWAAPMQVWRDIRAGIGEARRHPWFLSGLAALTAVIATGYSATGVLLPILSEDTFDGPSLLVAGITAYTLGAIFGAVIVARVRFRPMGWWALAGLAVYGLVPLSMLWADLFYVVVVAYALAGLGIEIFNVLWFTATQREVPADHLARVSSFDFLCSYGLAPIGLALIVPMADVFGQNAVLIGCAAICMVAPILAAVLPSSKHMSRDQG